MSGTNTTPSKQTTYSPSDLAEYRKWLIEADLKVSEAFDKAVMTLSGGALGISLTFIKSIVPNPSTGTVKFLGIGWAFLVFSIVLTLLSLLTSQWSLWTAIKQVDQGRIYKETPGGWKAFLTTAMNVISGLAFVAGVVFLAWFAIENMAEMEISPASESTPESH